MTYDALMDWEEPMRDLCELYAKRTCGVYSADELFSDVVVEKWPQVWDLWSPSKGPLLTYLKSNMRWYMYKHVTRRRHTSVDLVPEVSVTRHTSSIEDTLMCEEMLNQLDDKHRRVVEWVLMKNFTLIEVSDHLGSTPRQVSRILREAVDTLRAKFTL